MREIRFVALLTVVVLGGCAAHQDSKTVLIRQPGNRTYDAPADLEESASQLWEYAVLSDDVYARNWTTSNPPPENPETAKPPPPPPSADAWRRACEAPNTAALPLPGWRRWTDFPPADVAQQAGELGLYVEVWQRDDGREIAVTFQGTNQWLDWRSNFRWFLRFVPFWRDQYTFVAERVGAAFVARFPQEAPSAASPTIVATGHSLGGGLATHFAYSLPAPEGTAVPRVAHVYGFDPSPVTGWSSVDHALRRANASGLAIDRIFENGEILAYIRLLMRYLNPPSAKDPAIRELRYDFVGSGNKHWMRLLACGLAGASHEMPVPADVMKKALHQ